MEPTAIADILLGTMLPENRVCWKLSTVEQGTILRLVFRQKSYSRILDIKKLSDCFQDFAKEISWQDDEGDQTDSPCIVIQGGIKGVYIQAVFSLQSPDED